MFESVFVKLIAGFLRLRKLLSPLRLLSFLRSLYDKISAVIRGRSSIRDLFKPSYPRIETTEPIEEERLSGYRAEWYYPVRIGEVFLSRYKVIGKLGFGMTATAWLARDLNEKDPCYVTLKVYVHPSLSHFKVPPELAIYERLNQGPKDHPGREAIRPLIDSFTIKGPAGKHHCLVHPPLWGSLRQLISSDKGYYCPPDVLAVLLKRLLLALDYAKECQVIHTDIDTDNIMFELMDTSVLEDFEKAELKNPSRRKEIDGRFIYECRKIPVSHRTTDCVNWPILCDFGAAVVGGKTHLEDVQRDHYRAPEVILAAPWSYKIDIWNVGCLAWYLCQGDGPFDPYREHQYHSGAHLAEMGSDEGSSSFLDRRLSSSTLPPSWESLQEALQTWTEDDERDLFVGLMHKMLQWDPNERQTAGELLEDEWFIALGRRA
ncbi:Serine/threonine-protein kinase AFC3 [Termitomyces sp. J132]|nr:Serine/threonine-protein kinase AFC3 [Termitomyces sp. J132]